MSTPSEIDDLQRRREKVLADLRFRALTGEFIEISERLCDARLRVKKTSSDTAAAEKGGSRKRSRQKLKSSSKH